VYAAKVVEHEVQRQTERRDSSVQNVQFVEIDRVSISRAQWLKQATHLALTADVSKSNLSETELERVRENAAKAEGAHG
jgi:hypothetical protein